MRKILLTMMLLALTQNLGATILPEAAFGSLSVRTAYEEPNPVDYEVSLGASNVWDKVYYNYRFWYLWERENGQYFKGYGFTTNPFKFLEFDAFEKEANNLSSQSTKIFNTYTVTEKFVNKYKFLGIFKNFAGRYGLSINSSHWREATSLGYLALGYSNKRLKFIIETESNLRDRHNIKVAAESIFIISKKIAFVPILEYRYINKTWMWFKAKLQYKL